MGEFWVSAAVCAVAVLSAYATGALSHASPLFALSLFALSLSGYFALAAFRKSGVTGANSAAVFILAFACAWGAASLFSSSISLLLPLAAIPICLCAPAASLLVHEYFIR